MQYRRDELHRTGAVQGVGGDQVFEAIRRHLHQEVLHSAGFKLKNASRFAPAKKFEHLPIGEVDVLDVDLSSLDLLHQVDGSLQRAERAQPEKVHLQQANLLDDRTFELREDVLAALVERNEIFQRLIGDDDTGSVHAGVAGHAFQSLGDVDDFFRADVGLVKLVQLRHALERLIDRNTRRCCWNQFGNAIDIRERNAEHAPDVLAGRLRRQRAEGDDLRDMTVFVADVLDDLAATVLTDVDVDIGHLAA